MLKKSEIRELVDPGLANDYNTKQMNLMLLAASLCIHQSSLRRPRMAQVSEIPRKPNFLDNFVHNI